MAHGETTQGNGSRDSRTGLPGRDAFYREVEPLVADAVDHSRTLVLLDIDVHGIELILRTFGPAERDGLVRQLGDHLRTAIETECTPYHITQGRFAIVLPDCGYSSAVAHAQAVSSALRKPLDVGGISYHVNAFVGISQCPNHAGTITELVRTAVFACHQARRAGTDHATFDRTVDEHERHRFRLMIDLERALENGDEIRLAYQPQVELESGHCIGAEGLCRWEHPRMGNIPPIHFLPFVEQTSLMMPFTEATLSEGLRDLAAWSDNGFSGSVAVNLSPALFRRADLLDRLLDHFRFSNMELGRLHFEVTETGIMEHPNNAANTLAEIRERGSRIAVDDFGTGHSSLAYLADLPIDIIKIDRHFVKNLWQPWGEAIVGAAAMLAGKLGLGTVAEGIEDEAQYNKCRELGVDFGQGYHIGRPMFRADFERWLAL